MTLDELRQWEAYYQIEPWGTPAEDDRWRQHLALFFSANTSAGTAQPDWLDRDPEETARLRAIADAESLEDRIDLFFAGLVANDEGDD